MRVQAKRYGARLLNGRADAIEAGQDCFLARGEGLALEARTLLLATGTKNRRPNINLATHRAALDRGLLRYCPVCDGFEATGQAIGVIGGDVRGAMEAMFLRTYSDDITLLAAGRVEIDEDDRTLLGTAGLRIEERSLEGLDFGENRVTARLQDGTRLSFDTVYPALGSDSNDALAQALGLQMGDGCCIAVDQKQRTSHESIYAAGDIVYALDQISVAMGHAAIAATTLHNDLRARDGQTRAS